MTKGVWEDVDVEILAGEIVERLRKGIPLHQESRAWWGGVGEEGVGTC